MFAVLHSRLGSRGRDSHGHVVGLAERPTISCSQEDLRFLQNSRLHSGAWTFCVRHFLFPQQVPFNIIALDRLKNLSEHRVHWKHRNTSRFLQSVRIYCRVSGLQTLCQLRILFINFLKMFPSVCQLSMPKRQRCPL